MKQYLAKRFLPILMAFICLNNIYVNADVSRVDKIIMEWEEGTDGKKPIEIKKMSILKYNLIQEINTYGGEWSIYIEELKTGNSITINNQPMCAASLIKLYMMAYMFLLVKQGSIRYENVEKTVESMIEVSSNSAFNNLVKTVDIEAINSWIKTENYTDTKICHGLSPSENNPGQLTEGENTTSVVDCGKLLESIYNDKCVSKKYSRMMLNILEEIPPEKAKWYRNRIPAGVPEGTVTANKTGDLDDYCHDCAIVFNDKCDYIICIMTHNDTNGYGSEVFEKMSKLSKMVYDFLTQE